MDTLALDQIRLTHVRLPFVEPFVISNGVAAEKDAIIVEILADDLVGMGEASPMAGVFYSHHTPESSWSALTDCLIPHMNRIGRLDLSGAWIGANASDPFAVNGVDVALWDLAGKARNKPIWALLGGDPALEIPSGLAVGIYDTVGELLACIDFHLSRDGYRRVKIKVQPGWDVKPLHAVRERFGRIPLMVDANGAYRRTDIEHVATWDRFELMMIEQPLPQEDLEGHALLGRRCRTPICLDESAASITAVKKAIDLRAAGIINIKLQRVGTIEAARRIHDITEAAGIGCWMGTMPELGIAAHAAIHCATLPNIRYPTDVEASDRWFVADVTVPPVRCRNGLLIPPKGPGLGVMLNEEIVDRYRLRRQTFPLSCRLSLDSVP